MFLEVLAAKDEGALVHQDPPAKPGEPPGEFMLSQMPDDRRVIVDSHSSSPAFAADSTQLAFGLAKAGAVDPEGLLYLTRPPQMDMLLKNLKKRQAAEAAVLAGFENASSTHR